VYIQIILLTRKVHVPFQNVGQNLKQLLENKMKKDIEGKCSVEGFYKTRFYKNYILF